MADMNRRGHNALSGGMPTTMAGWQRYADARSNPQGGQPQMPWATQGGFPQNYNALMGMMQFMQPGMWGQTPQQNAGQNAGQGGNDEWTKRIGGNANWLVNSQNGRLNSNPGAETYYHNRGSDQWFQVDRSMDDWRQNMDAWTQVDGRPDVGRPDNVRLGPGAPARFAPQATIQAQPRPERANPQAAQLRRQQAFR